MQAFAFVEFINVYNFVTIFQWETIVLSGILHVQLMDASFVYICRIIFWQRTSFWSSHHMFWYQCMVESTYGRKGCFVDTSSMKLLTHLFLWWKLRFWLNFCCASDKQKSIITKKFCAKLTMVKRKSHWPLEWTPTTTAVH